MRPVSPWRRPHDPRCYLNGYTGDQGMSDHLPQRGRRLIMGVHAPDAVIDQDQDMVTMPCDQLNDALDAAYQAGLAKGLLEGLR